MLTLKVKTHTRILINIKVGKLTTQSSLSQRSLVAKLAKQILSS